MPEAVVDTNILVRIATGDNLKQAREAAALISHYEPRTILLPEAVLAEAVFVLNSKKHYSFSRSVTSDALKEIIRLEQLICDRVFFELWLELFGSTKFDFVDCMVLACVKTGQAAKLLSFDSRLLKAAQG